jgi:hypothetical protein
MNNVLASQKPTIFIDEAGLGLKAEDNAQTVVGHKATSPHEIHFQGAELTGIAGAMAEHSTASIDELCKLRQGIADINLRKAALSVDKRAGHVFENWHSGTYNASARAAGDRVTTAVTGSRGGFPIDPRVDIKITQGAKVLMEIQAKCCSSAGRSAVSVAKARYVGTQRIIPAEQVKIAKSALLRSAAGKQGSPNPLAREIGKIRAESARKVAARITAAGHESRPLSHSDAQKLAQGKTGKIDGMIVGQSIGAAVQNGAVSGAILGSGISVATNLHGVINGTVSAADAATSVAIDATTSAARGAGTVLVAEGVKYAGAQVLTKEVAQAFIKGSAPLAVAGCAVELAIDTCRGELTVEKAAKSAGRAASAWAGCEGGALLGTAIMPGVGTVVGGIVGGLAASLGFNMLFE